MGMLCIISMVFGQAKLLKYPKTPKNEQEMAQIMKRQVFAGEVQALAEWLVVSDQLLENTRIVELSF